MATKLLMFGRSRDNAAGSSAEVDDVLVVDDVATALDHVRGAQPLILMDGFLKGERDVADLLAGMAAASRGGVPKHTRGGFHNLCHRAHLC